MAMRTEHARPAKLQRQSGRVTSLRVPVTTAATNVPCCAKPVTAELAKLASLLAVAARIATSRSAQHAVRHANRASSSRVLAALNMTAMIPNALACAQIVAVVFTILWTTTRSSIEICGVGNRFDLVNVKLANFKVQHDVSTSQWMIELHTRDTTSRSDSAPFEIHRERWRRSLGLQINVDIGGADALRIGTIERFRSRDMRVTPNLSANQLCLQLRHRGGIAEFYRLVCIAPSLEGDGRPSVVKECGLDHNIKTILQRMKQPCTFDSASIPRSIRALFELFKSIAFASN